MVYESSTLYAERFYYTFGKAFMVIGIKISPKGMFSKRLTEKGILSMINFSKNIEYEWKVHQYIQF